ncbi:Nn.00g031080.m01.CDS01 [Neocucurbitaria sp. VM-36]
MTDEDPINPASSSPTSVASFSRSSTAAEKVWNSTVPPFPESDQLYKDLHYAQEPEKASYLRSLCSRQTLPDAPRVRLECASQIISHCLEDLDTPRMNKLGEKLWWAGPIPEIKPLTQQLGVQRKIMVIEDPSVHLLWTTVDAILYVKPLPAYLTSFAFWKYLLDPSNSDINPEERARIQATSLGFLKTYSSLIQRRSDFNLARRHDLLASFGNISFEAFVTFISHFDNVPSSAISSRWRFGLLQLDALNFHSVLHLRRWHFNRYESRYGAYFQRFFPVVLFIFALLSVILSAMQVILAGRQIWDTDNKGLKKTLGVFEWAGTEAIAWSLGFGLVFIIWWISISTAEACKRRSMQKKIRKRLKEENVGCP